MEVMSYVRVYGGCVEVSQYVVYGVTMCGVCVDNRVVVMLDLQLTDW